MTFNTTIDTGLRRLSETTIIRALRHPFAWRFHLGQPGLVPVVVIALLGTIVSLIVFEVVHRTDDARVARIIEFRADWRAQDFESKLAQSQTAVAGLAAFIASQKEVSATQFRDFSRSIHFSDPSSAALSWDPLVKASERDAFVAGARQTIGNDFDIVERAPNGSVVAAAAQDEYLPLLFYESFDNSAGAAGLDVLSLPGRRAWIAGARDAGRPIATPPIQVFASSKMRLGSVIFWPVYSDPGVPATLEARRQNFRGMAVSRTDFNVLLSNAIGNTPLITESIEFLIDHRPIAVYDPGIGAFAIGAATAVIPASGLTLTREFDILGQHWTLISHFPPEIVDSLRSDTSSAFLLLGLLLTTLLAIFLIRERGRRAGVEAMIIARSSELTDSERRFRQIFDDNPVGLALKPTDNHRFERVNAAYCRMLGYPPAELLKQSPEDLTVAEDRGILIPAAAGTSPLWHPRDKRYITKSGETVYAQVQNLHLGALPSGKDVVLSIANDVTEQRKTEAALQQAQKMEAIGNLTGGMAHDFNNLLGIVIGNLDLLRDLRKNDAEADELARDALDASLRGADLTKRLLAFARRQALQPKQVAVNELVSEITKLLTRTLGAEIVISLKLSADVWPVFVDPAQLDASLTNLATNARDAMPRGGKLIVTTANRVLDADYAAMHTEVVPGDYVLIEVSDTGAGMSQAITSRIFEPFYTTKEPGKGTGLGLSMVFGFIKQSGGHINVYSEPGVGTTFGLYLPRMMEKERAVHAEHPCDPLLGSRKGETVLTVEDDASLRRVVVRQLTELGYRVLQAENAAAAIEVMEGQNVDLLFSDIVMPGGTDGVELACQVHRRWPKIRVLLTSGFPETSLDASNRSLAPGTRMLTKPYRKVELAAAMRAALDA